MTSILSPLPPTARTLDDVRVGLLAAEDEFARAAEALVALRSTIEVAEATHGEIARAGEALRDLHEPLGAAVRLLRDGGGQLQDAVAALRAVEPTLVLRRIDALESTLHAGQDVAAGRLRRIEERADERHERQWAAITALEPAFARRLAEQDAAAQARGAADRAAVEARLDRTGAEWRASIAALARAVDDVQRTVGEGESRARADLAESEARLAALVDARIGELTRTLTASAMAAQHARRRWALTLLSVGVVMAVPLVLVAFVVLRGR